MSDEQRRRANIRKPSGKSLANDWLLARHLRTHFLFVRLVLKHGRGSAPLTRHLIRTSAVLSLLVLYNRYGLPIAPR